MAARGLAAGLSKTASRLLIVGRDPPRIVVESSSTYSDQSIPLLQET